MTDAVSVAGDVSDGLAAGKRAPTLNRVYAVLSEVGSAMVRASDPGQLLTEVCRILVETGGFSAAAFTTAATHPDGVVVLASWDSAGTASAQSGARDAIVAAVRASDGPWRIPMAARPVRRGSDPAPAVVLQAVVRRKDHPCVLALRRGTGVTAADEEEAGLLAGLAGNIGFVLDALSVDRTRVEAIELATRRAREQSIVSSLGVMALGMADTADVIDAAVASLAPLGLRQITLYERSPSGDDEMLVRAAVGEQVPVRRGETVARATLPLSDGVLTSAEPVMVGDFSTDARFTGSVTLFPAVGSAVSVPIRAAGVAAAVLTVHSFAVNDFDSHDIHFYEAIANVIGGAMERARYEEGIRHDAMHSPLTGLPNRDLLQDRLRQALRRSVRHQANPLAVLVVDVDGLKRVNNSLGHAAGDHLLALVGARLRDAVRPSDTVAHLGGDVFAIICEDLSDTSEAATVADRMLERVREVFMVDGSAVTITASIGIAASAKGSTVEGLLRDADVAMYRAKGTGRDRYETVDDQLRTRLAGRVETEQALSQALAKHEFRLVYQPKVSLLTDRIIGVEALLRWHRPRGIVPPLDFIPIAEESGLIVPIGAWVLEEVCRDATRWATALPGDLPLSVALNVSPRQFEPGLAATFGAIITAAGVDPATLCLEVTESMVMHDAELAIAMLRELKSLGLQISIDDFGTGLSSLAYLKRFPLDELKIDKSFVDGLGHDPEDTAIVAAVMGMAHALSLRVVAEGVESPDQLTRLRMLGCDAAQGYHLGRPVSAAAIDDLLLADAPATGPQHAAACVTASAKRVLVVDDAGDVRQLARASLASVGYEVAEASSGEEALALIGSFRPDCVVLDVNLPGINGLEVCRILRETPETRQTTIVIASAEGTAVEKVQAFSLTADDYMVKPFSPRDLVSRVAAAVRMRAKTPLAPLQQEGTGGGVSSVAPVIFPRSPQSRPSAEGDASQYLHRFDLQRARFFDLSVDLMAVAGFDGYFKSVNPAWAEVFGFSEDEMLDRPYLELVHPDDRDATAGASSTLVEGIEILTFENRYVTKGGTYRWLLWRAMPVVAEGLVYATARDITADKERLRALAGVEKALRLSDERSRLMVENIRDYAIFTLNPAGRVASWNAGAAVIKGYAADEIIGEHFSRFYTDEDRASGKPDRLLETATSLGRVEDDGWRLRKDGSAFFANVVITALFEDGGPGLRGFAIVTRDVSERHEAEAKLATAHRELAQRTLDLTAIGEATRAITASSANPRREICAVVAQITGAGSVCLWEAGPGVLLASAVVGFDAPDERIAVDSEDSGAAEAFRRGERIFVADARSSGLLDQGYVAAAGAASVAFQPVMCAGSPCAVLALAWTDALLDLPSRMSVALDLLAAETAVIIERAALRKLLVDEARVDALTGIPNRRAWDEEGPRFLERARRSGGPLSLAVIALDRFKAYNDRHGHQAGDRLLRAAADAWRGRLRGVDLLARCGGEEFGVLLSDCDLDQAVVVCESLSDLQVGRATWSVGVAQWNGNETLAELADRADAALYAAKRDGRNRVRSASAAEVPGWKQAPPRRGAA